MHPIAQLPRRLVGLITAQGPLCEIFGVALYRDLLTRATLCVLASGEKLPRSFSNDDLVAVYWYTHQNLRGLHYKSLNAVLRGAPHDRRKELLALSSHLTVALESLPCHVGLVSRTCPIDIAMGQPHIEGEEVVYPAFTSASRQRRRAPLGGTYIAIESKTGRYIGGVSRFPREEEVLFLPGTRFRVLTCDRNAATRLIQLEEV